MTEEKETYLETARELPVVRFVGRDEGDEHDFSWDELMEGTEYQDPATVSDDDLLRLLARALDRSVDSFGDVKINRPETGNILVRPTPRYGVLPEFESALVKCFYCGQDSSIVMNKVGTKANAKAVREMSGKVVDFEPCSKCKKYMEHGIILIGIDPDKSPPNWDQVSGVPNPWRTGSFWVLTDDAVASFLEKEDEFRETIMSTRWTFIDQEVAEDLGLPVGQENAFDTITGTEDGQ